MPRPHAPLRSLFPRKLHGALRGHDAGLAQPAQVGCGGKAGLAGTCSMPANRATALKTEWCLDPPRLLHHPPTHPPTKPPTKPTHQPMGLQSRYISAMGFAFEVRTACALPTSEQPLRPACAAPADASAGTHSPTQPTEQNPKKGYTIAEFVGGSYSCAGGLASDILGYLPTFLPNTPAVSSPLVRGVLTNPGPDCVIDLGGRLWGGQGGVRACTACSVVPQVHKAAAS